MAELRIYQLQTLNAEQALLPMLEKVLQRQQRAVIRVDTTERGETLSAYLWQAKPGNFIPHGTTKDGHASRQPIWITAEEENPNGADILFLIDGSKSQDYDQYSTCVALFQNTNLMARTQAVEMIENFRKRNYGITVFLQNEQNGWQQSEGLE